MQVFHTLRCAELSRGARGTLFSFRANTHSRQCGPARCVPTAAASTAAGLYCSRSIPTEPDLPGPHYVSGVLPNREPSSTDGQSTNTQSTASDHSSSSVLGAHTPLGASTVCDVSWHQNPEENDGIEGSSFVDFDNRSKSTARVASLHNPLNGFTYTRAPLLLSGTVKGLRHNPVTDAQLQDAPETRPGCGHASEPFPIENALVEVRSCSRSSWSSTSTASSRYFNSVEMKTIRYLQVFVNSLILLLPLLGVASGRVRSLRPRPSYSTGSSALQRRHLASRPQWS